MSKSAACPYCTFEQPTARWLRQAQPPRHGSAFGFHCEVVSTSSTTASWLGFRFLLRGGFDRLNHRDIARLSVSTARWFRQAQPPRHGSAFGFHCEVVSTGRRIELVEISTTATWLGFRFLPRGGFDRLNHRDMARPPSHDAGVKFAVGVKAATTLIACIRLLFHTFAI
jgi:hypothetical protein